MRESAVGKRRMEGGLWVLVNTRGLQLECARVLHESLLLPVLMYGNETMIWKEEEMSRIRAVHMDNLRGLMGIRKMAKVPNAWIRELCRVTKGLMKVFCNETIV